MGMPEPLDVWLGKDEVEGVPSPAAEGPEAAAELAARGSCRDRASPVADHGCRRAHRRVHPGPGHLRRVAARARRRRGCSAAATHDGSRSDAVLGGHRAAPFAGLLHRGLRRPGQRLGRCRRGRAAAEARRGGEPGVARQRPARRLGRARGYVAARGARRRGCVAPAAVRLRRSWWPRGVRRRVGRRRLARRHGRRVRVHAAARPAQERDPHRRRRDRSGAGADRDRRRSPTRHPPGRPTARGSPSPRSAAAGTSST